ncbi:TIGR02300 family protein [Azospirillum formosense]|uniref:TIGR02300 family protein n=1 Tax=Azospirillum formosense TaxID=861533 RepID=UPI0031B837DD
MAKPEWGVKRICPSCGARYYDLRKDPPVCPSCGAQFDPEALLKSRKARPAPVDDVKKAPVVSSEDEDAETETESRRNSTRSRTMCPSTTSRKPTRRPRTRTMS